MKRKNLKIIIFVMILIILTILSLIPSPKIKTPSMNDKFLHFAAYIFLSFMADMLLNKKIIVSALILFLYGVSIELIQYYLPFRQCELLDIAANTAGIIVFFAFKLFWIKIKDKRPVAI